MITILDIVLLLLAGTSALMGFGGSTCREGTEPLRDRITWRGWVFLICLILATGIGIFAKVYSGRLQDKKDADDKLAAQQVKLESVSQQRVLQAELASTRQDLAVSSEKLNGLRRENQLIQEQLTGGRGFPLITLIPQFPDIDGSFPLVLSVSGKAPVYDVSYSVSEGPYKRPTAEGIQKLLQDIGKEINSPGKFSGAVSVGTLYPGKAIRQAYRVRPKTSGDSIYNIDFHASNGTVEETLEVRFDGKQHLWQFRYKVVSYRRFDANKMVAKQDWIPTRALPVIIGDRPPIR